MKNNLYISLKFIAHENYILKCAKKKRHWEGMN